MKTEVLLERARAFVYDLASKGGVVLFVGTKKQAKDTIRRSPRRPACSTCTSAGWAAC